MTPDVARNLEAAFLRLGAAQLFVEEAGQHLEANASASATTSIQLARKAVNLADECLRALQAKAGA